TRGDGCSTPERSGRNQRRSERVSRRFPCGFADVRGAGSTFGGRFRNDPAETTPGVTRDVTLRRATAADAEAIVALMKSIAIEGRWIRTQWPFDEAERADRYRRTLGGNDVLCIVAESTQGIVGQISLFPSDGVAEFGMVVKAEERRRGLGRRLLDAGESLARE